MKYRRVNRDEFPLAKIRKSDGTPAIWLTQTIWYAIRYGLIREYRDAREAVGQSKARRQLKQPDAILDHPICHCCRMSTIENSMALFKIGCAEHGLPTIKELHYHFPTPESLAELGEKAELKGFDEMMAELTKKKEAA